MTDKHVVLVAEDDASVRLTVDFLLSDEGFDVRLASDGHEALTMARAIRPDVILLDQRMPKMDGRQVLKELRLDPSTSAIPVIVLTGLSKGSPGDWPGAHFVGKPFRPEELVDCVRSAVHSTA